MKLIREVNESLNMIVESKLGQDKQMFIEGVFLQSNVKNRNGRIYPEAIMDKEVNRYINDKVNNKTSYGELGHPANPSINPDRISHLITSLTKDGSNWIGKAKLLDTPMATIAKGILNGGGRLGTSSRALGSLKLNRDGINEVQSDFLLCTAGDIVTDPSGPDCWVEGLMESAEWIYQNGKYEQIADATKQMVRQATSINLEEQKILAFEYFLRHIK